MSASAAARQLRPSRRLFVLIALALGLWLARDALLGESGLSRPVPNRTAPALRPAAATLPPRDAARLLPSAEVCTTPGAMPQRANFRDLPSGGDPFATEPLPSPKALVATPSQAPVATAAVRPVAPPTPNLPYRFMGLYQEPGRNPQVFLSFNGALLVARAGESLQGGWRLESIGKNELIFMDAAAVQRIRMAIEGETP